MSASKNKLLSGFLWNLGEKLLIQVISFIVGLILARKLGPETYGVVATVSVIISLLTIATNLYTGTYLMRKKEVDSLDMNTSFYFGLFINILIYLILFFFAPLISQFYNKPELTALLRVMGIGVLASSFMGVKLVVVVRNYQYKKLFFASLTGTIIAGLVGIVFAFIGFGAWALVAQHTLDCVVDTIILWIVVRWAPKFEFSFKRLKEMVRYGFPLWLFGIADSLSTRLQQLVIGKQYTSSDLAFYNRGESFPSIIESNTTSALNTVLLRKVSEEQDNIENVKKILSKITKVCLYISFPTMFGLAAVANTTILLLLGEQWLPSVIFVQIFCLAFAIKPIEVTSDISLKALGKTKQFFVFGLTKKIIFILSIIVTVPLGIKAIAMGFLVASVVSCFLSIVANRIYFNLGLFKQLGLVFLPSFVSIMMWVFIYRLDSLIVGLPLVISLVIQILCGFGIYLVSLLILDSKTVAYFKSIMSSFFNKTKRNKQ